MAKRSLGWTEDKIARYIKEGRGQGEGTHYKPWLTIQDVPSTGRVHRIKGNKTGRIHQLLSDQERDYFYLLEWADEVIDIREQFPLHREATMKIAEEKNIRHPMDNSTQTPLVMTTDFLVSVRRGNQVRHLARTVKASEELNVSRTIEKFEIERAFWESQSVDWGIVTENEIHKVFCRNVAYVHSHRMVDEETQRFALELYTMLASAPGKTISEVFEQFEMIHFLEKGGALTCFKHLLSSKQIVIDMNTALSKRMKGTELEFRNEIKTQKRWGT